MWVRFSENFNWNVPGRSGTVSILYKPRRYLVKRELGEEAIAKGVAVEVPSPREEAAQKVAAKATPAKRTRSTAKAAPDGESTD